MLIFYCLHAFSLKFSSTDTASAPDVTETTALSDSGVSLCVCARTCAYVCMLLCVNPRIAVYQ